MSNSSPSLPTAKRVLLEQASALSTTAANLNGEFEAAVTMVLETKGHLIVSGVGKSGLVGKKIAATLTSTGTPAFEMHPTEAFHGDLGSVTKDDAALLISYSGETEELVRLITPLRAQGVALLAMTGNPLSSLAKAADVHLCIAVEKETCPHNLAPTTSTTVTMALGDALAVALMAKRGFAPEDFAKVHPGGSLGKALALVSNRMHTKDLPVVREDQCLAELVNATTKGRIGAALVCDQDLKLVGLVTDGDLRRALQILLEDGVPLRVSEVMTRAPVTVSPVTKMAEARAIMESHKIKVVPIVDENHRLLGVVEWSLFS